MLFAMSTELVSRLDVSGTVASVLIVEMEQNLNQTHINHCSTVSNFAC